jgi:Ca2+-dependent lipid-binding protein|nr:MAG TPA: ATP synthase subunit alpha [Caudoviricetes sp.]DAU60081.1 MAG TPA: ATP synthase subunit alpha [Caudoviricetes sp.]
MGNWEKKQEEKQNIREREMVSKETLGKFFYDLSKLSFAALVIGSVASVVINKNNIDSWIIISIGAFVTYIFAYIGYKIIK